MPKSSLIAMTPRAGKSNHRYIVPTDCSLSEIELSDIIRMAKNNEMHTSSIHVLNNVQQTSGGRFGTEVLVLTNAGKTSQWSRQGKKNIQIAMEQKLQQLGMLVEQTNWDSLPIEAITQRPEMTQWQSEMQTLLEGIDHPEAGKKIGIIVRLILTACLLAGAVYGWNQYNSGTVPPLKGESKSLPSGIGINPEQKGVPENGTGNDNGEASGRATNPKQESDPIVSTLSKSSNSRITLEKFISKDNDSEERRQAIRDICKAASELAALSKERPEPGITDYALTPLWKLIHEKVPHDYVTSSGQLDDNEGKVLYNLVDVVFGDDAIRSFFNSDYPTTIGGLKDYVNRERDFLVAEDKNESRPRTIRNTAKLLLVIVDLADEKKPQPKPPSANDESITR